MTLDLSMDKSSNPVDTIANPDAPLTHASLQSAKAVVEKHQREVPSTPAVGEKKVMLQADTSREEIENFFVKHAEGSDP
ncbi:hypothetical protein NPIL_212511 [Nephila pilipes]|uniref:Uncharacterized protein n=1 Tax=Nephila pilipes TaxID=299642 RepID=A0A8X6NH73_NEPPI|nr:hypothetical protein NPIL_212511 [Nephila pilipes]